MTQQVDVAIIGAGAAGISAARRLADKRRSILLVEALPRLGGRAHTETIDGMALDFGCGWMHSAERNPLARIAEDQSCDIDRRPAAWGKQLGNIGASAEEREQAWNTYGQLRKRLHSDPPASDRVSDALPPGEPWKPFMDALSSFINGVELDCLSVKDFLAYEDASSSENWRLPGGYGAFIASLGAGLPAALNTRVTSVACESDVVLETENGAIRARAAIITAPPPVLARGSIRFSPEVDDHLHAAACLPLGLADKVFLKMAKPEAVPVESHLLGRIDRAATGSYYMRPLGRPVVECFLGGAAARELENAGDAAAVAFVTEELRRLLGSDFADSLSPVALTHWAHEPTILGSYSHALPGHADARATLARPVNERLCFAGEACSTSDFSTAHGAWESGLAAADWIDSFLTA